MQSSTALPLIFDFRDKVVDIIIVQTLTRSLNVFRSGGEALSNESRRLAGTVNSVLSNS